MGINAKIFFFHHSTLPCVNKPLMVRQLPFGFSFRNTTAINVPASFETPWLKPSSDGLYTTAVKRVGSRRKWTSMHHGIAYPLPCWYPIIDDSPCFSVSVLASVCLQSFRLAPSSNNGKVSCPPNTTRCKTKYQLHLRIQPIEKRPDLFM